MGSRFVSVGAQKKLKHHLEDPTNEKDPAYSAYSAYSDWLASDCCVITWLLNNMDEKVSSDVMFLKVVKDIWFTLKVYGNEKEHLTSLFFI